MRIFLNLQTEKTAFTDVFIANQKQNKYCHYLNSQGGARLSPLKNLLSTRMVDLYGRPFSYLQKIPSIFVMATLCGRPLITKNPIYTCRGDLYGRPSITIITLPCYFVLRQSNQNAHKECKPPYVSLSITAQSERLPKAFRQRP